MWKKLEQDEIVPEANPETAIRGSSSKRPNNTRVAAAAIGPSVHIRGDLVGKEDIVVHGRLEGTVSLEQNNLHVGSEGWISADVKAKTIDIEGTVQGELHGSERVSIRRTGRVQGNISAPRLILEDGCKFKGTIDMDFDLDEKPAESRATVSDLKQTRKPAPSKTAAKSSESENEPAKAQVKTGK